MLFFFFQAEDGIRDGHVTGVQTCALPIFRTNNIEKDAERFRKLGLIVEGPIPFERKRPDGSLLTWKLLFIGMENTNLPLPFLIQWDDSDDERLSQLKKQGAINQHPLGKTILISVGVAVQRR